MNVQPNWTVTNQGPWQLIYNASCIVSLAESIGMTSTEANVFVGTQEECEAEQVRLGLPWASDVVLDPDYQLIHDSQNILYFSIAGSDVDIIGTSFVGKMQECEAEIARLGLTWASVPVDASDAPVEVVTEEVLPVDALDAPIEAQVEEVLPIDGVNSEIVDAS